MNRIKRFYKIDQMLHARSVVSLDAFLTELEVSRATFKQDMEYLRERLHAPIVWDRSARGYRVGPAATRDIPVKYHPDQVAWMNQRRATGEEPVKASTTMNLQGASMFLSVDGWDADDYSFHAPIKSVAEFTD